MTKKSSKSVRKLFTQGVGILLINLFFLTTSCSDDPLSEADTLLATCYNTLQEHSYYSLYLKDTFNLYHTPNEIFFDLPDTLKGNYYSYYTETGGNDGYPWPLFASSEDSKEFGFVLRSVADTLFIQKVFSGSSADKAGLKAGDQIIAVDNHEVFGNPRVFEAATERDKSYSFSISRNDSLRHISLSKALFTYPLAYSDSLAPEVGYIALSTFYDFGAAASFSKALEETKQFPATIIDLRGNGGGYIDEQDKIIDHFLNPRDTILLIRNHFNSSYLQAYYAPKNLPTVGTRKFVLLVDGGSASASEMLVVGLQYNLHTPIVGVTTYGKAIGQAGFDFREYGGGSGQTTVMGMVTPDRTEYAHVGITPDYVVNQPTDSYNDAQLEKAIEVAYQEIGSTPPTRSRSSRSISTRQLFNTKMPRTSVSIPEWGVITIN